MIFSSRSAISAPQGVADMRAQFGEARVGLDVALPARTRKVDLHLLFDAAGARLHDDHAVREIDRLVDTVRDKDNGVFRFGPDLQQLLLELLARLRVNRAERLVHEQDVGLLRQRARDADALLHTAGDLVRIIFLEAVEADELEVLARDRLALLARDALDLEAEFDVGEHRAPGKEAELLENHAAVAPRRVNGFALGEDLAAGGAALARKSTRLHP